MNMKNPAETKNAKHSMPSPHHPFSIGRGVVRATSGVLRKWTALLDGCAVAAPVRVLEPEHSHGLLWGAKRCEPGELAPHSQIIGGVGSGKTILQEMLMRSALVEHDRTTMSTALRCRALVYDPKTELFPVLVAMGVPPEQIVVLNPFDARCTPWDIAADVRSPDAAKEVATILCPHEKDDRNPYFNNAVRDTMQAVFQALHLASPGAWNLNDVVECLSSPEALKKVLRTCEEGERVYVCHFMDMEKQNDTTRSVMSTIRLKVAEYETVARLWDTSGTPSFSIQRWMDAESEPSVLLLPCRETARASLDAINRALFSRMTQVLLDRTDDADRNTESDETWVFIDELVEAGTLDFLPKLMDKGRSKGARVVLGMQTIEGLYRVYGQHLGNEILGLCGNYALLKQTCVKTADYCSQRVGDREIMVATVGYSFSRGRNWGETSGKDSSSSSTGTSINLSYSASAKSEINRAFLASEFLHWPKTSREQGMHVVFGTGNTLPVKTVIPGAVIDWLRPVPDAGARAAFPAMQPRPSVPGSAVPMRPVLREVIGQRSREWHEAQATRSRADAETLAEQLAAGVISENHTESGAETGVSSSQHGVGASLFDDASGKNPEFSKGTSPYLEELWGTERKQ